MFEEMPGGIIEGKKPLSPAVMIELRRILKMSQRYVAEQCGVQIKTVSRWEKGSHVPSPMAMRGLLKLFSTYDPAWKPLPGFGKGCINRVVTNPRLQAPHPDGKSDLEELQAEIFGGLWFG